MSKIKLGVTLYSFSTEYCKGIMTLEECIRTAKYHLIRLSVISFWENFRQSAELMIWKRSVMEPTWTADFVEIAD